MKQLPENMKQCVKIVISNDCPSEYGLVDHCDSPATIDKFCLVCWEQALDEIENE